MTVKSHHIPILEAHGIVKDFPGQRALDHVDFDLRPGEVHALIGENGAGKSTLIKVIAGVHRADKGEILINGVRQNITRPRESQKLGIGFIHQELNIVPHISAAENIFLGQYPKNKFGLVSFSEMVEMAEKIPDALNVGVDLRTPAMMLSVIAQWKMVINRVLAQKSQIIFMDEPTGSLTHQEVNDLFKSIVRLKDAGKAIVYVSHRMEEIFKIADRVTVIKDAQKMGTLDVKKSDPAKIYQMMLGKELKEVYPEKIPPQDQNVLAVKNITREKVVHDVTFEVARGEILCLAGLVGSGRTELARLIFGADRKDAGEIFIDGHKVRISSTGDAIRHRIALVPEERRRDGLVLPMNVMQNTTLASLKKILKWQKIPIMNLSKEKDFAQTFIDSAAIKTSGPSQIVRFLSGGNQQKVVLAKWLSSDAEILIFDEPTRGIDVGARFSIYKLIADLAGAGKAIILISSDMTEVVGMAHRILVMNQGRITAELQGDQVNLPTVLQHCLGDEAECQKVTGEE